MKKWFIGLLVLIIMGSLGVLFNGAVSYQFRAKKDTENSVFLLVPSQTAHRMEIRGWRNMAGEIGIPLHTMSDQQFMNTDAALLQKIPGIILPDVIHPRAATQLVKKIQAYVKNGGQLMLIYDAGTLNGDYKTNRQGSPFSTLLGFTYALGNPDATVQTETGFVGHEASRLVDIGIPPGKCIPQNAGGFCAISTYFYGALRYTYLKTTAPSDPADMLLTNAAGGFVAGVRPYGAGKVLFVNLPLTNLWKSTDSLFMQVFLQFFGIDMLHLVRLSPMPNGVGGLVLNLHAEDILFLKGFTLLNEIGFFQQGPYSIDITAGPGLMKENDGKGPDVLNNVQTQTWILNLLKAGHVIGSDGGWLHDYFGTYVNANNSASFLGYIQKNIAALEKITGKAIREYMPPMGNQPRWATEYLAQSGVVGYYTTANMGSAPTRYYFQEAFDAPTIWSFPLLPFQKFASLRDFGIQKIPPEDIARWFDAVTQFVSRHHTVRLVYFHPSDVVWFPEYLGALKTWLALTQRLQNSGVFRWYTMAGLGEFLNSRRQVVWDVRVHANEMVLSAEHPVSLQHFTWFMDKKECVERPEVIQGQADIAETDKAFVVRGQGEKRLVVQCQHGR